jgi:hypothetical protein
MCACPKTGPRFITSVVFFMFNDVMWEVIHIDFIDIGGIVDEHSVNFLFIMSYVTS